MSKRERWTEQELMEAMDELGLFDAVLGDDNDGQIIIYTGLKYYRDAGGNFYIAEMPDEE